MDDIMTPEQLEAQRRAALDRLGFSRNDWARIRATAEATTPYEAQPALQDLSVPYRVAVTMLETRRWMAGRQIGVVTGRDGLKRAILIWRMTDREREEWARRRPH